MNAPRFQLKEIAESVSYGVTASACDEPVGPKFLRITDIQDGQVDWNEVPWCDGGAKPTEAAKLRRGDIVFARTGATTGKSFLIGDCPENAVFASYLIRVRLREVADPGYVSHFFQTADYWGQITKSARGAAQPGGNATTLKALQVPLPPLAEQKRIAGILDAADALRAKRRESLAQLDTLLQSTFLDMFGDPVTNPMGWEEQQVDDICRLVRGSSPRPKGDPQFYGGPVPRLMVGDITRDGFWVTPKIDSLTEAGAAKSRPVPAGTVVMAVSGDVGVVATVQVPCCVHDGFVAFLDLDENAVDSRFFMFQFHFLKMTHERRKAGAIFQNLTTKDIKAMRLPTPPLELQRSFARTVDSVGKHMDLVDTHLDELDTLFASLQSRAFRGDL